MKQAKIMLSVIALIAIVGGALAFKTNRFLAHQFFAYGTTITTTTVGGPTVTLTGCVVPVALLYTTSANPTTIIPASIGTFVTTVSNICKTPVVATAAE